jgi:hypothetical protein
MRTIHQIAKEIKQEWKNVSPYAKPYLDAMTEIESINGMYYEDTARSVVTYFLANAQYWRGDKAREIKKELNKILDNE